ncbi:hypothetical protein V5799_032194 [Amblyomma americanum]|uniref:Uncharacterized protein n=1 Tax=Amblyomma americanum TaxID=6943 RepID=A0AAQ4DRV7_AMBAM
MEPGRTIGAYLQAKMPVVGKPPAAMGGKQSEGPTPARGSDPNLPQKTPEARTQSPVTVRQSAEKLPESPSLWTAVTKRSFSTKVYAVVTIAALAFVSVLAFLLIRSGTKKEEKNACATPACEAYSKHLLASINTSVSPCESFTHYVCDGWRRGHELSVNEDSLQAVLNRLSHVVANLNVPDSGRSTVEHAAVFYRSCECVGRGECDQLPDVMSALAEAGIVWPRVARSPDVLRTILYTTLQLGWGAVLTVEITSHGGQKQVVLRIADEFRLLKRKMDEHLSLSEGGRKRYFDVLRDQFLANANESIPEDSLASFEETRYVELYIFNPLWGSVDTTPISRVPDILMNGTVHGPDSKTLDEDPARLWRPAGP